MEKERRLGQAQTHAVPDLALSLDRLVLSGGRLAPFRLELSAPGEVKPCALRAEDAPGNAGQGTAYDAK